MNDNNNYDDVNDDDDHVSDTDCHHNDHDDHNHDHNDHDGDHHLGNRCKKFLNGCDFPGRQARVQVSRMEEIDLSMEICFRK